MLSLLVAMALGQSMPYYCADWKNPKTCYYTSRISREPRAVRGFGRSVPTGSGVDYAFFEFAPADGAGMGTACACGTVTGARSEAITFGGRASSAYCTKEGSATTGLTTASMVQCSTNQLRVETDAQGYLGARTESARTNSTLRSEEWDHASYSNVTVGASAVVVTADTATTPWGTLTADTLSIGATTAGQVSIRYLPIGAPCAGGATCANSIYVMGVDGGAGVVDLGSWGTSVAVGSCSYNGSTWTRCEKVGTNSGTPGMFIGNTTRDNGGVVRAAQSIYVAGSQMELGAYATSYIATTTAAVTRAADGAVQFAGVTLTSLASTGSASASITPLNTTNPVGALVLMASAGRPLYINTATVRAFDGTNERTLAHGLTAGVAERYYSTWTGSTLAVFNSTDGTTATGSFDGTMATTGPLQVGSDSIVGTSGDWIISRVCLDPSTSRCR